jgi:flagellar hook-basal body complex protein FliE
MDFKIANTLGGLTGVAGAADVTKAKGASGFGAMLGEALQNTVDAQKTAEATSVKAVAGKADVTDVVTAVTNAEVALDTVVALRDRVISAYQEILRMPI